MSEFIKSKRIDVNDDDEQKQSDQELELEEMLEPDKKVTKEPVLIEVAKTETKKGATVKEGIDKKKKPSFRDEDDHYKSRYRFKNIV